jgi:hypothetical protein
MIELIKLRASGGIPVSVTRKIIIIDTLSCLCNKIIIIHFLLSLFPVSVTRKIIIIVIIFLVTETGQSESKKCLIIIFLVTQDKVKVKSVYNYYLSC